MDEEQICWLCGRNGACDPLEKHHAFTGALRKKADKYGAYVYLCGARCHRLGRESAHRSRETRELIARYCQRKIMKEQGWTTDQWIREFGKNYL